ncbi:MAG: starvation-sensing protein RspA [Planctomycetes bacterium]|nr:starvation-sensing protein RspA [Planctomycetota bacterium]
MAAGAGLAGLLLGAPRASRAAQAGAAPAEAAAAGGSSGLKITRVRAILTAPAGIRLVVVKVETSEPGLYGLGCATFTQRARPVVTAVDQYLAPFLAGKDPLEIEDLWQAMFQSSYWRNGPVLMNALSGVDMALWDILGKRAGMPVYRLLGGKCRTAVHVYRHASGGTPEEVVEQVRRFLAEGVRHVRIHVAVPGHSAYGARSRDRAAPAGEGHFEGHVFEPAAYRRTVPKLFEHVRKELGDEVELLHDIHERLPPIDAIGLCREVERYRPFFMEDPFAPEDVGYFKHLRAQTATPIAMGELFNNPNEWVGLVSERLIDFIRCHLSQVGGITMGRKIAALCDFFRVRTAWHGPGDVSPVGHAANLHLDLATWNFGIQEAMVFNDALREVFPGAPELVRGMLQASEKPGLGVDVDEALAAKHPIKDDPPFDLDWGRLRGLDGTIRRP